MRRRVEEWRRAGTRFEFGGHGLHLFERPGEGAALLLLHGFPSSSFDWRGMLEAGEFGQTVLAPDFLGFGLSDKPADHTYSLHWQADMVEALVADRAPGRPVFVCAHDMGTSVATELLARDLVGKLGFELSGALLFNGSIVLAQASLTWAQRLLRGPAGPLAAKLTNRLVFERQFGGLFSPEHPIEPAELADQWDLVCANGGRALGHRLVHYLGERVEYAERWHGAISEWPRKLSLMWGTADPVATTAVLGALVELRPGVSVERLEGIGHYPQLEVPATVAGVAGAAVRAAL